MAKIALITDTHIGARSGSKLFRDYFKWYFEYQFFPILEKENIKTIIHGGDFFDNRNAIQLQDIQLGLWFVNQLKKRDIKMHIIPGNHDIAYKNTNEVHSLELLVQSAYDNVVVYESPEVVDIENSSYMFVPWINKNNQEEFLSYISNHDDKNNTTIIGHFEIEGAVMQAGSVCEHGLKQNIFKDYKKVVSGHFHQKGIYSNIEYIGALFHYNWSDYNNQRGFYIIDQDQYQYIENEYCLFQAYEYDYNTINSIDSNDLKDLFESRFVKLVINDEYNKIELLDTVKKIQEQKPFDLQVIDNFSLSVNSINKTDEETDIESKSTLSYIGDYIKATVDKKLQSKYLSEFETIYNRATELKNKGE